MAIADLLGNPIKSVMYSLDCFIVNGRGDMPFIYYRHAISYIIFVFQIIVFIIGFYLIKLIYKDKGTAFGEIIYTALLY